MLIFFLAQRRRGAEKGIIVLNSCYAHFFDRFFTSLQAQEYDLSRVELIDETPRDQSVR
jgi:hypothetical protein